MSWALQACEGCGVVPDTWYFWTPGAGREAAEVREAEGQLALCEACVLARDPADGGITLRVDQRNVAWTEPLTLPDGAGGGA